MEVRGLEVAHPGGAAAVRVVGPRLAAGQKLGVAVGSGCGTSTPALPPGRRALVSEPNPPLEVDR